MENNNKNKTSLKNKVLSVLFLTWFIGSIVAMIVFSNINEYYSIMFFGQYFIVFGLQPSRFLASKKLDSNSSFE